MKVGGAGELFVFFYLRTPRARLLISTKVFEILSQLQTWLLGFDRANWQSTIRWHVNVHEDYRALDPWKGAGTAEITYDDTEREFTKLLIENGYLERHG